jgi:hypothetical protein
VFGRNKFAADDFGHTGSEGKRMSTSIKPFIGLAFVCALGATAANAQTPGTLTQNTETGHYYQVFGQNGISWAQAQTYVNGLYCLKSDGSTDPRVSPTTCTTAGSVLPHLATITSSREDVFVEGIRATERLAATITRDEIWVGGLQAAAQPPGTGWSWVNGEGNISTPQVPLISYSNWLPNEPNDNTGPSSENFLAIGLGGNFGWNDEGALGNIGGYLVEWDVPRDLGGCVVSDGGCITIEGHMLTFPENSVPPGTTFSFNSFEFDDPRVLGGVCDNVNAGLIPLQALEIFGNTGIGSAPGAMPSMFIPWYLCGSPKFVVVTVDTDDFQLTSGTVLVENDTFTVLPGNVYPDGGMSVCEDPIVQVPFSDGDPRYQDVVVWQTTDPTKMLENLRGGAEGFPGAAGEFTNGCGSSTARVRGASNYGIGFHIDFGPGNSWAGNPTGLFTNFVALTRYKLTLLLASMDEAIAQKSPNAIINNGDRSKMKNMIKAAIKNLDDGNYSGALTHVNNFLKFVVPATYNIIPGKNFKGEHQMRGENIEFTLRVKIIPYAGP